MVIFLCPANSELKSLVLLPMSDAETLPPVLGVEVEEDGLEVVVGTFTLITEPLYQKSLRTVAKNITPLQKTFQKSPQETPLWTTELTYV